MGVDSAEGVLRLVWTTREKTRRHMRMRWTLRYSYTQSLKEMNVAPNSLEFKLASRTSPPFYAKQVLSHPKEKWTLGGFCPAPRRSQPLADLQNSCRSCLSDNYSVQPCRRTPPLPLKTGAFHIHASIFLLFPWVRAAAH